MTTRILHIIDQPDFYEVSLNGPLITKIMKFVGDSGMQREVEFDDLSARVQSKIVQKFSDDE